MAKSELHAREAHSKAEWLAYLKHLAELEELRALEQAYEQAVQQVLVLRSELLDARLDLQGVGLARQVLQLARQFDLVYSFRGELQSIILNIVDPSHIVRQIRERLKVSPCESIDWTRFDEEFRSTYPEFQSTLLQRYPELTEIERRVNVLLKLRLISADIARLLCVSERSIERHRLHIRRKMGLAQWEDVYTVLAGI